MHFKDFTRDISPNLWFNEQPSDDYGHGTHVAGIIAGSGYDSDGRRTGVAPGAKLLGLKVLDGEGNGYVSDVIAAIDYADLGQVHLQRPRHQSLGRPPVCSSRTGPTRSPSPPARRRGRDRRRRRGRQSRS